MLRLPDALVAALRFLRLAIPPLASVFVSPLQPDAGRGPGALSLAAPRQWLRTGDARISQVPGEPCCAYALFSDPGRTAVTRPLQCSGMAPAMATAKAPTIRHFRGSIARLGHSLSTLRRASHLAATQDSFSGAGQALPDGIGYPQGSDERFPSCFLHLFPLSQAFLTQCHFATVHPPPCMWRVASQAFLRRKCLCTKIFLTRHRQGKKWRVASKSPKKVSANYAPTGSFLRRSRKDARFSIVSL